MNAQKLTIIDNGDGSITVDRNGSYTCVLFKHGGGGVESLAYEMAEMLSQAPAPAPDPADIVQLVGVKDGVETVIGTATMSPKMKAQELVREMFGAWEHDDGSDADLAFAVCEQLIKWMPANPPVFNVEAPAVVAENAARYEHMRQHGFGMALMHDSPEALDAAVDEHRRKVASKPPVQGGQ